MLDTSTTILVALLGIQALAKFVFVALPTGSARRRSKEVTAQAIRHRDVRQGDARGLSSPDGSDVVFRGGVMAVVVSHKSWRTTPARR